MLLFMKRVLASVLQHRLLGGISVLAATQFFASVAGLLRDRLLSGTFPGLGVVDAYLAAFRPSDLLFQTCVASAMGTVLVPVLAKHRAHKNDGEIEKVLSGTIGMTALVFGVISLLLAIFFPWLTPLFGIAFEGQTLSLYVQFGRLALLSNFLFVFGNAYGQYLITVERYWIYGITPILYTLGTIAGTIFLTPIVGAPGPMYGTLIGAVLYVLLRMWGVHRSGCKIGISLWHPEIPSMVKLMLPRILALGAFQVQLLYLAGFASGLPRGSVTIDTFARNFQSVIVGVVGIAVAQAVYSRMSQAAATGEFAAFRKYYNVGLLLGAALTVVASIILVLISPVAAWLVGLTPHLTVFSICLGIYAISIPFESATHIQYRAFYALRETVIPAVVGVIGGLIAIGVAFWLLPQYGLYALAVGYTVGEVIQAVGLGVALPIRERHAHRKIKQVAIETPEPALS